MPSMPMSPPEPMRDPAGAPGAAALLEPLAPSVEPSEAADAASAADPLAVMGERLAAWRAQDAHRADPAAFLALETLARRAAGQPARVRAVLAQRLEARADAFAARLAAVPADGPSAPPAVGHSAPPADRGALGRLADELARRNRAAPEDGPPLLATAETQSRPPELKALRRFRGTWSRLSAQQRLREATAQVPAQAGPLNSHHLVHRALALMQQLAPGYLEHFVAYADALQSIEQLQAPPAPVPAKGELRAAPVKRRSSRSR
ncbi:DUF2894 domain-containing protein [Pseudacidovorax intermedius]|nr:DUF2894 domain-containing protein [Pseudacidovorax intermedius]